VDVTLRSKGDTMVSQQHARFLWLSKGQWAVIDDHSANGVLINSAPVPRGQCTPFAIGDLITFGTSESDFVYAVAATSPADRLASSELPPAGTAVPPAAYPPPVKKSVNVGAEGETVTRVIEYDKGKPPAKG
jgi:pSer/pThr/pTyr-binding forkhead associated (FHA) protein